MTPISPLSWPLFWKKASAGERFLRDVPFIGLNARTRRFLRRQLLNRPQTCSGLWAPPLRNLAAEIAALIRDENRWPNACFIPEDPCAILLWDSTTEMRCESILLALRERYGLDISVTRGIENLLFGELVSRLAEAKRNNDKSGESERGRSQSPDASL